MIDGPVVRQQISAVKTLVLLDPHEQANRRAVHAVNAARLPVLLCGAGKVTSAYVQALRVVQKSAHADVTHSQQNVVARAHALVRVFLVSLFLLNTLIMPLMPLMLFV